jgi:hypothetical protein
VSADQREVLSFLIALQWTRSRFLLTVVRRDVPGRDTPMDESKCSLGLLNIVASLHDPWACGTSETRSLAPVIAGGSAWIRGLRVA